MRRDCEYIDEQGRNRRSSTPLISSHFQGIVEKRGSKGILTGNGSPSVPSIDDGTEKQFVDTQTTLSAP